MKNATAKFRDFVRSQDPAKPINHTSWTTCAIGEFYAAQGVTLPDDDRDSAEYSRFSDRIYADLEDKVPARVCGCHTYGDIVALIDLGAL